MNALDRLIALHQEAYDETFSWEKRHRRHGLINRVLLVFNAGLFINNTVWVVIFGATFANVMLALIALGLLAFTVWLIQQYRNHMAWILETRADWEVGLRHWQAVKIELAETGTYPEWAMPPPNYS